MFIRDAVSQVHESDFFVVVCLELQTVRTPNLVSFNILVVTSS